LCFWREVAGFFLVCRPARRHFGVSTNGRAVRHPPRWPGLDTVLRLRLSLGLGVRPLLEAFAGLAQEVASDECLHPHCGVFFDLELLLHLLKVVVRGGRHGSAFRLLKGREPWGQGEFGCRRCSTLEDHALDAAAVRGQECETRGPVFFGFGLSLQYLLA